MPEYNANEVQTVQPGETIVFTNAVEDCRTGLVNWIAGTGIFNVKGTAKLVRNCCGKLVCPKLTSYFVDFGANIAVPTGQTPGEMSVAISVNGVALTPTTMNATPGATGQYFNISRATNVQVITGCCSTISVKNTSTIPILVRNANIVFAKPDRYVTT